VNDENGDKLVLSVAKEDKYAPKKTGVHNVGFHRLISESDDGNTHMTPK